MASGESDDRSGVGLEDLVDKLRILNYQRDFCRPLNLKPFHRSFFSGPSPNPNEQFFAFTSLFSWLAKLNGVHFETPGQFDDPNATASEIISIMKKMGITGDFGPTKLKQGYGDAVLQTLNTLTDKVLQKTGFTYKKPVHLAEDFSEEAEADDDAEVTAEAVEDALEAEEDEEEMYMPGLSATPAAKSSEDKSEKEAAATIESKLDPAAWRLEVERVAPQLRIIITNDNKDWRVHLQQMKQHEETIHSALGETKTNLDKLRGEIQKALEKIASREKHINGQFSSLTDEYRTAQEQLTELVGHYTTESERYTRLNNEQVTLTDQLESIKNQMEEKGSGMTDQKPLARIKQALARIKGEIRQMDLRIGVVMHTLLQAKMSNKSALAADIARMNAVVNAQIFAIHVH